MSFWFLHGLRKGVRTTDYPRHAETARGVSPGRPVATDYSSVSEARNAESICPVHAISASATRADVDLTSCIWCQRCRVAIASPMNWAEDHQWVWLSNRNSDFTPLPNQFGRSVHVMVVDAGDCGACLHEIKQLNNPLYNMHRLGIFLTATPRMADLLLVVGPVTENMRVPLLKTYEAMPTPKRVLAVGTCAINGGVFGQSFVSCGGVSRVLPVDLEVPGDPPPPLAILDALLTTTRRSIAVAQNSVAEGY
jgi:Ni,Fe-hydrogenase III small subunit